MNDLIPSALAGLFFAAQSSGDPSGAAHNLPFDFLLTTVLQVAIFLANLAGGLVVGVAIIRGLILYVMDLVRVRGGEVPKEAIRLSLGRSLSLALEFQLGADILGTALNPSLSDIATLAAIVILRTVLNFFLARELREAQNRDRQAEANTTGATRGPGDSGETSDRTSGSSFTVSTPDRR